MTVFLCIVVVIMMLGMQEAFVCSVLGGCLSIVSLIMAWCLGGASGDESVSLGNKVAITLLSVGTAISSLVAVISIAAHFDDAEDGSHFFLVLYIIILILLLIYAFSKFKILGELVADIEERNTERQKVRNAEKNQRVAFLRRNDSTYKEATNESMEIGAYQYAGRSNLHTITIASSCKSIGEWAFQNCSSLTRIEFSGSINAWKRMKKHPTWDYDTPDYLVVCKDGTIKKSEQ